MSGNDQRCATTIFEYICHSIPGRHHDIFNHVEETCAACLNKRNLRLKPEKCEFHREEVDFLEFVVERHEIRMNLKKIRAVKE